MVVISKIMIMAKNLEVKCITFFWDKEKHIFLQ